MSIKELNILFFRVPVQQFRGLSVENHCYIKFLEIITLQIQQNQSNSKMIRCLDACPNY